MISLMPVPIPEMAMPPVALVVSWIKTLGVSQEALLLADKDVHGSRRAADHLSDNDGEATNEADLAATDQVRQSSDKGRNGRGREKVGRDEPDPVVSASELSIDVSWCASYEPIVSTAKL